MPNIFSTFAWSGALLGVVCLLVAAGRRYAFFRRSYKIMLLILLVQLFRDAASLIYLRLPSNLLKVSDFLFVFLLVTFGIYLLRDLFQAWFVRKGINVTKLFWDVLIAIAYSILILFLLKTIFHVDITALVATSAILTVVLGLAVQDTLINLIAGVVFHFEDSIRPGDWIEVDGKIGEAKELSWRAVRLVTSDDEVLVIPNQDLTKKRFTNLSRQNAARVREIGVSYNDNPDLVIGVLKKSLLSTPGVCWQPEPVVYIREFGESAIIYRLRYHLTDYRAHNRIAGEIFRRVYDNFKRHHITFPFPSRTLHIERRKPVQPPVAVRTRLMETLGSLEMFRFLDPEELAAIAEFSEVVDYPEGSVIAVEGEEGRSMFVIVKGNVNVIKEGKTVATLARHDIFGEIAIFTGEKRGATVVASSPLQVVIVYKEGFDSILKQNEAFIAKIERMIEERLKAAIDDGIPAKPETKLNILRHIRRYLLGE